MKTLSGVVACLLFCASIHAAERHIPKDLSGPRLSPRIISTDHHASGHNARTHSATG
jgi:hypothetical protein